MLYESIKCSQSIIRDWILLVIDKTEIFNAINSVVHILAHKLRDVIIKAIVCKRNMIASILNK